MTFEYKEDETFFEQLLCEEDENLEKYFLLFDFRKPETKREEFNKIQKQIKKDLLEKHGKRCFLKLDSFCNIEEGIQVDHIVPLSSNILNKEIRKMRGENGKKVTTQSFGSNNIENLQISCKHCNGKKKHRFLSREEVKRIFKEKIVEQRFQADSPMP